MSKNKILNVLIEKYFLINEKWSNTFKTKNNTTQEIDKNHKYSFFSIFKMVITFQINLSRFLKAIMLICIAWNFMRIWWFVKHIYEFLRKYTGKAVVWWRHLRKDLTFCIHCFLTIKINNFKFTKNNWNCWENHYLNAKNVQNSQWLRRSFLNIKRFLYQ